MSYEYMIVLVIGIAVCLFPKHIRKYNLYEWGEKKSSFFIKAQRMTGMLFIVIAILLIILGV